MVGSRTARLNRLERIVHDRPDPRRFSVVQAVTTNVDPRPPGLYRDGPPGSTAGLLVYDPAIGVPVMPERQMAPWGLLIVCEPSDGAEPL